MSGGITALQKSAENARDNWSLGMLMYKNPAATGYDPADDLGKATLAAMAGGAGIATVEFNGAGYSRKDPLTFVDPGSGVVLDTDAIAAQLHADAVSYVAVSASADLWDGEPIEIGGMLIFGQDAGASDDGDRWPVRTIALQKLIQPDGGSLDPIWPNTGILIFR